MAKARGSTNPFRFGALALDEAFTDRDEEIAELAADMRNGQDVVVFAPRRYGKSSLVWRVAQQLVTGRVLVAQVDLMRAPTKERLAEKLASAIHDDLATPLLRAKERLRMFRGAAGRADRHRRPAGRVALVQLRHLRRPAGHRRHAGGAAGAAAAGWRPSASGGSCSCSTSSRRSWTSTPG